MIKQATQLWKMYKGCSSTQTDRHYFGEQSAPKMLVVLKQREWDCVIKLGPKCINTTHLFKDVSSIHLNLSAQSSQINSRGVQMHCFSFWPLTFSFSVSVHTVFSISFPLFNNLTVLLTKLVQHISYPTVGCFLCLCVRNQSLSLSSIT